MIRSDDSDDQMAASVLANRLGHSIGPIDFRVPDSFILSMLSGNREKKDNFRFQKAA